MSNASQTAVNKTAGHSSNEFLVFSLGVEEYGIEILKVQEIRGYETPTTIANSPPFVRGVINLRGSIVPIIDMRLKFNLESAEYNAFTVVIVLNLSGRIVGIVVDSVADVITLTAQQLRPVPEFSADMTSGHILALGTVGERVLILMDIEKLMSSPDMGLLTDRPTNN